MIYVEGKGDSALVRVLTQLPRRRVVQENGKGGVMNRLRSSTNGRAMIDEDPEATQPAYQEQMWVSQELSQESLGLKVLEDTHRGNLAVLLCPRLEEWIIRAARDARVNMSEYNLSDDPTRLREIINTDLSRPEERSRFWRLLQDLKDTPRLQSLSRLLSLKSNHHEQYPHS